MSDQSSIISISERMAASDTDDGQDSIEYHVDTRKYYIPERENYALGSPTTSDKVHFSPTTTLVPGLRHVFPHAHADDTSDSSDSSDTDDARNTTLIRSTISRPASIFSLSRVSFTSQLAELTSIRLPNAVTLSERISSMPTATAAARALCDSAEQILQWIRNALSVLQGLNAEDDVEWAAAAGREGLNEVDKAVSRFETVIKVYILSVEELQMRSDITVLPRHDLTRNVVDMEAVLKEWQKIKDSLDGIKDQVEIAMEWEELWNHVLGAGIGQELDNLARLVFEMEEKRHQSVANDSGINVDIDELKTIVEEVPAANRRPSSSRYSLPAPFSPASPLTTSPVLGNMEDGLLALFARMQPLRASLDFLPMRLSVFHCRGNPMFPSACLILEERRDSLEAQWKKLEADAESLRRELGEDRWLLVFRNAGRQALKMCESVSRTMEKLRHAVQEREQQTDAPSMAKKIESYEAKKTHYGPAIERVLAIVDRGVLDRLTVNGEILGLQSDMKRRWAGLQANMRDMDSTLLDMNVNLRNQQLRDSISTILSSEQSLASSYIETPRSSSASSVSGRSSYYNNHNNSSTPQRNGNKLFKSSLPRKTYAPQPKVSFGTTSSPLGQPLRALSPTLTPVPFLRQFKPPSDKPRWNGSYTSTPLSGSESKGSSSRRTITPRSAPSKIPTPSHLGHVDQSPSKRSITSPTPPMHVPTRYVSTPTSSPLVPRVPSSLSNRTASSSSRPNGMMSVAQGRAFTTPASTKRTDFLAPTYAADHEFATEGRSEPRRVARAPSAMAVPSGRKSSLLSQSQMIDRRVTRSRADRHTEGADSKPFWR